MTFLAFLFEVSDKIPTVGQIYFSGAFWAIVVFISTFFNRWLGLVILIFALWISTCSISDALGADILEDVIHEMGNNYLKHWNYSIIFSVILEVLGFVLGIILKNVYRKRKLKVKLK